MHFIRDLGAIDRNALEALLARTELVVAYGEGEVRGLAAAAFLFADYAVLHELATLVIDEPEAWAAVAWRLGRRTIAWAAGGQKQAEVVDEITSKTADAWIEEWMRHRSVIALDAAALLIRARGGDSLERAEFARLFAIGEPQKGLGAFLAKVRPSYSTENL
jgi:site-specific recombinase XerC